MDIKEITGALKKHWPWALGGVVGIWLVMKYVRGGNTGGSVDNTGAIAQMNAMAAAANANAAQSALASQQLQNQADASTQAAQVAQVTAVGNAVQQVGTSIAGIIGAQSYLPAQAINAATSSHQTALMASAQTAIAGLQTVPQSLQAGAQVLHAAAPNISAWGATVSSLNQSAAMLGTNAVNAISATGASSTSTASQSGIGAANANAQVSIATLQMITEMSKMAAMGMAA